MYYIVGRNKDHVFVFDSSDSSCELVSSDRLKESGVEYHEQDSTQFNVMKLRTLYNFDCGSTKNVFNKDLVYFTLPIRTTSCNIIDIIMVINIMIVAKSEVLTGYRFLKDDNSIFLSISPVFNGASMRIVNNPMLMNLSVKGSIDRYTGMLIPYEMFNYIMSIRGRDINLLFDAFDGYLSRRLYFVDNRSSYSVGRDSVVREVKWC